MPNDKVPHNKMLIDATHPEETRVVVLRQGRVEEFDYESAARKLLRGNIYLAKVTRVEPSLQAAFVEYGGNRHGFLAFNEIHPDYYQIPVADRRALIEAEAAEEAAEEAEATAAADAAAAASAGQGEAEPATAETAEQTPSEAAASFSAADEGDPSEQASNQGETRVVAEAAAADPVVSSGPTEVTSGSEDDGTGLQEAAASHEFSDAPRPIGLVEEVGVQEVVENGNGAEPEQVDSVGSEDALEELPSRPRRRQRSYKIQEVIKRRQVILVQVVKEERGTKGAALTTYLSLAGRYTVLMPNTARGGGISRKITNAQDRKRLKAIADELEVPEGMGLIIRTAGASRTKAEIKRDFEYLLRLWENVRDVTLQSTAPVLVYEEGDLIKRAIRDLYGKDVEEIIVAGANAHKEAKDFMRMLMPSHAKNVLLYEEPEPLFSRFQIERQLNAMFSPYVHLKSGGYLVINQTEALVAIDVNSGKATREFSIEETALHTNLEAADEIARQLKLRDLAGLIVIDFIDMEEKRNNRAVERRLKDALRFDRARIQVGRISHFGLLEMSRQRLRTGVLEGSTSQCPHCQGTGIIRSTESVALAVLRGLEDALMAGPPASLITTTSATVALYILNNKRPFINDMEARYGVSISITASDKMQGANFSIERTTRVEEPQRRAERAAVNMDWGFEGEAGEETETPAAEGDADGRRPRRRRRRRGGRRDDRPVHEGRARSSGFDAAGADDDLPDVAAAELEGEPKPEAGAPEEDTDEMVGSDRERQGRDDRRGRRGRRRGRRGGRGNHRERGPTQGVNGGQSVERGFDASGEQPAAEYSSGALPADVGARDTQGEAREAVGSTGSRAEESAEAEAPVARADSEHQPDVLAGPDTHVDTVEPPRARRSAPVASEPVLERVVVRSGTDGDEGPAGEDSRPVRRGWWQRKFSGE
jgi:ribonuclease E